MKPRLLFPGLFVLAACFSLPALADDENDWKRIGERPGYIACLHGTGGITASILTCDGQEQGYQDRRINTAYRTLMTAIPIGQRQDLRLKERAWINGRDSKCKQPSDSGTAGDINYSSCFLDETARQAAKLEGMAGGRQ